MGGVLEVAEQVGAGNILKNKNIVLCVTGGIACYKAVYLASFLKKEGANVYTVMTKNATKFVDPLSFKTITKNKVTIKMFETSDFVPHISLSKLADLVIVAPATANIIAKAANGIADDMVSTLLLSVNCPKLIVPAMNNEMYLNPITQDNIERLKKYGFIIVEPETGDLACGTKGIGRFPDIEKIYGYIIKILANKASYFSNKKVLITLGGTIEDIDPVRCITNRSSGKMGFSFAKEFILRNAEVTLIVGNVNDSLLSNFKKTFPFVSIIKVRSAREMFNKIMEYKDNMDIYVMAAAVSDYYTDYKESKIKKEDNDELILKLKKNIDILKTLPKRKNAIYIGFAAESENLIENAKEKMIKKDIDFIVVNKIIGEKSAMGGDNAEVYILSKNSSDIEKIDFSDKAYIAAKVCDFLEKELLKGKL